MKRIDKLALVRKQVVTWEKRRADAVSVLVKAELKLPMLRKQMTRLEARRDREMIERANKATAPEPAKPTLTESCDYIVSAMIQGKTFEQASDDLDIPESLRRIQAESKSEPPVEQIKDEAEQQKKLKAIARKLKRKGMLAEREAHDAIPKSKRRWDASKSQWIAA